MTVFSIRFRMPYAGGMNIDLYQNEAQPDEKHLWMPASHILSPGAPQDLVLCLISVLAQKPFAGMMWWLEPEEYHFEFRTDNKLTLFQVNEHLSYETVKTHFEVEMPSFDLVVAFWRGLRCIQSQILDNEFQEGWYHAFPNKELEKLTEQLREIKRNQK